MSSRASERLGDLGARLGVELTREKASFTFEARSLELCLSPDASPTLCAHLPLAPALDLGLRVRARAFDGPVEEEDPFEASFILGGDEPGRVRDLVGEEIRDALVGLHEATSTLLLTDEGLSIAWSLDALPRADEAVAILAEAARACARLERSAAGLRSSVRLRGHAEALARLADEHGLTLARTPIGLAGSVDGIAVSVRSERTGWHEHRFTVAIAFPCDAPPFGVTLRRARLEDTLAAERARPLPGFDDPVFDGRFQLIAEAVEPARLERLFDQEVRAALVELDTKVGRLSLDSEGLHLSAVAAELRPDVLATGLLRAVRVVRHLVEGPPGAALVP